ncbi:amino acid ABC transporter permease [Sulfurifustis variabilis]|uniref:Amino acid ABC transporter permease n=1 Tax=Sulfurifustis variabilis TaxID=1675686 RepID=A0A1B4V1V8_9GAMM|nr:glycine betaine ABC transporter substrate-binding protein [Sulfurifustis variabilis]BAU47488.1 amino acid ABC transporter permease [Sulfurifustis variabilis]
MKAIAFLSGLLLAAPAFAGDAVTVGSKKFTESVILGEAARQLVEAQGMPARHRAELGGTRVLWNALLAGDIDIYPEYTGTLRHEIFAGRPRGEALDALLAEHGVRMTRPLGFNNTYALGMRPELAERLGIRRISDLKAHPGLAFGFSSEFMDRADGWRGLRARYGLPQRDVRGLDHDLAYRGLAAGSLHVVDLYSTDAEIEYYDLSVLEDDLGYFPDYRALFLYRADLADRAPKALDALRRLEGRITAPAMTSMNARAKLDGVPEARVAAEFLGESLGIEVAVRDRSTLQRFWRHTREHLALVGLSLSAAVLVAIPLGVLAWLRPAAGQLILGVAGAIQTIPALALLVFMIPLLGIGGPPAVVALFLYSLLPIVRNTHAGLHDVPPPVRESADALGLPFAARLRLVDLPLASRSILAGIKTSAVINVGTATLGALIGAGGYGQPILTGIRLDDIDLILQGAVPAAALALLVQGAFELLERWVVPQGLRAAARD